MNTKLSNFCSKLIEAGWLAVLIAVPLFFNIHTARTFEPDKLTLMRSVAVVMIVAWLIKVMEEGRYLESGGSFGHKFRAWLKQPFVLPTFLVVVIYLVSTIFALTPLVALWGSYQRLQGSYTYFSYIVVFALMAVNLTERAQLERLINTIIVTSVPVSLYGIIQRNGLDPLPWAGDVEDRVASTMGNAIFVASYLIMIVPITVSRLIKSMTAIVTEEDASWGHTILSAIYIFVLAIQMLTILYTQSRGPQVGLLGAFALMGLLVLLILRQRAESLTALGGKEIGLGALLAGGVALGAATGGALGFLGGLGIDALLGMARLEAEGIPLLGAALGALIGFTGVYTYLAATGRGWRWMWASWPILAIAAIAFILILNVPNGPLQKLRTIPYLSRLGQLTNTEGGTGKVRVLIWEGALELISPHRPIGVEEEYSDRFNPARPLIGYGPESMFNAFAFAYPPDLAHHEARGSSADRSHNETMDSLVITGILGFAAFYFLMSSLFYYALRWLGWVPSRKASYWLIGVLVVFGLIGTIAPYFFYGNFSLSAVFLPFGLFAAMFIYLCGLAWFSELPPAEVTDRPLLLIGLLGALVGHFLEVHFVFSIAATYTYFWAYLGLMIAMHRLQPGAEMTAEVEAVETPEPSPPPNRRRRRERNQPPRRSTSGGGRAGGRGFSGSGWEAWISAQGFVMAIILMILIFDFVPIQFDISTGRYSLLWLTTITLLVGLGITLSDTAIKQEIWSRSVNWVWGIILYLGPALGYAGFYILIHGSQRRNIMRLAGQANQQIQTMSQAGDAFSQQQGLTTAIQAALESSNGVFSLLIGFYVVLFILLLAIAAVLSQSGGRRLPTWRAANWLLYPPLIVAGLVFITFKNVNVVKADTLLKEGQKYRDASQRGHPLMWDLGIAVHQAAVEADSDEDFYYLMLALNYQLKAQDQRLDAQIRERAWEEGERIALNARDINKYNPDNTGNMGRYYFTVAQIKATSSNPEDRNTSSTYFERALAFFKKATQLAPQNVDYYNLVGQAYYAMGNYDEALTWYDKSVEIDARYFPSYLYKGDTHVAKQELDQALVAHIAAIKLDAPKFVDDNFDQRLTFYASINRIADLIEAFQTYIDEHPPVNERWRKIRGKVYWGIGHAYLRAGEIDKAKQFIEQAQDEGYDNAQSYIELGDIYLSQEEFGPAEIAYRQALAKNNNLPQVYSSMGYIYARTGRVPEAIEANLRVLESRPNDYDTNKNLALLYQQTNQMENALRHAQTALEAAPEANKSELETFIGQVQAQIDANK